MDVDLTELDFAVEDDLGGKPLTPENVNFPILRNFLEDVETFLKGDVPGITLNESRVQLDHGSLRIRAFIASALAFSVLGDLEKLQLSGDLDSIQPRRAKIIERWQSNSGKFSRRNYRIGSGQINLQISERTKFAHKNEKLWVDIEKYFTGKVYEAGGKQKPNLHIDLGNGLTVCVDATEKQLAEVEGNLLFKSVTLRIRAQQHLATKELRHLHLIDFLPYSKEVDEEALTNLWKKGAEAWKNVSSATDWVETLRGNKA